MINTSLDHTNEFGIIFSTVNGSGSATANKTILKAIFKMGIPVSGRNNFPSNIQGMPTWYSIRISGKGYLGRLEKNDILVCLNPEVIEEDIKKINHGGILLVDSTITMPEISNECCVYKMAIDQILDDCKVPAHLRIYLANMVYVGIIAELIDIEIDMIELVLKKHFKNRKSAVDTNMQVVLHSYEWSKSNISCEKRFLIKASDKKEDRIIVDGNTAAAIGALYGGLQFSAWYPITPATSIAESLNEYIPKLRFIEDNSTTTCVVVQAEDELASIGMVVGAGWAGLRSMTSTSGPGLCLMAEFLGLAYYAEVPLVVWDVQRVGPSTGLPTRTSQGDLSFAYSISHGDTDYIILIPANVQECFEFGWKALDIAEKFQTPVIILSDLELGMNEWVSKDFEYPDTEINRGKVIWEEGLEELILKGINWGRYLDIDKDGIPYRTIPGNMHPKASYFTRGTGHDDYAHYSEDPRDWERNLDRLRKKLDSAKDFVPVPVSTSEDENPIGLISYGSSDMAVIEAVDQFAHDGVSIDYMRIRALPFNKVVDEFLLHHEQIYIVECNRDGQMKDILAKQYPQYAGKLISISHLDGQSLSAEWINKEISKHL
jgi:2-oxoglutarate ferredoxin oxidoreductase subunit alpha